MTENRSVPTNTVLPHIYYQNVVDAIDWLTKAFGFADYRYGDPGAISDAQMHLGNTWIMVKQRERLERALRSLAAQRRA
jgi:uncharacterized glyoxalase superfamily protein PhnB